MFQLLESESQQSLLSIDSFRIICNTEGQECRLEIVRQCHEWSAFATKNRQVPISEGNLPHPENPALSGGQAEGRWTVPLEDWWEYLPIAGLTPSVSSYSSDHKPISVCIMNTAHTSDFSITIITTSLFPLFSLDQWKQNSVCQLKHKLALVWKPGLP